MEFSTNVVITPSNLDRQGEDNYSTDLINLGDLESFSLLKKLR